MRNDEKTRAQLIDEVEDLRRRVAALEGVDRPGSAVEEDARQLTAFHEITRLMSATLDRDEIVEGLARTITEAGVFRSLAVALVDEEEGHVEMVRSHGRYVTTGAIRDDPSGHVGSRYPLDSTDILAEAARSGEMQIAVEWDDRFTGPVPDRHENSVAYFIPVMSGDRVLAVLATGSTVGEKPDTLRRVERLQPLLDQVAIALEHSRQYESLQGEIADRQEAERARRASTPSSARCAPGRAVSSGSMAPPARSAMRTAGSLGTAATTWTSPRASRWRSAFAWPPMWPLI